MSDVIAFDIDGVLTEQEGIEKLREAQRRGDIVGVVTSRSKDSMFEFIRENNIQPQFEKSAYLKGVELMQIKDIFTGDNYIYYGSWTRDRIHAWVAGWSYEQI